MNILSHYLLSLVIFLAILPGCLMLTIYTWFGRKPVATELDQIKLPKGLILVPAYDDTQGLASTLQSLKRSCHGLAHIIVLSDHNSQEIKQVAWAAGALVLTNKSDSGNRAVVLTDVLNRLQARFGNGEKSIHWYAVVDVHCKVSDNFAERLALQFAHGADAVQVHYRTLKPHKGWRPKLLHLTFAGINLLRPRARQRLGLSCGLFGNGFALSNRALANLTTQAENVIEETEYHQILLDANIYVQFDDSAWVITRIPNNDQTITPFGLHGEGRSWLKECRQISRLLRGIAQGDAHLFEPLLNLLSLPTAYLLLGGVALILFPLPHGQLLGWLAVTTVFCYILTSARLAQPWLASPPQHAML
ncbi:glycosyltransferase [Neisseriaceae bacterium TC5R-5]|nr:glycosyltransferase [Neisseriaceae bacterium TC5R-5]